MVTKVKQKNVKGPPQDQCFVCPPKSKTGVDWDKKSGLVFLAQTRTSISRTPPTCTPFLWPPKSCVAYLQYHRLRVQVLSQSLLGHKTWQRQQRRTYNWCTTLAPMLECSSIQQVNLNINNSIINSQHEENLWNQYITEYVQCLKLQQITSANKLAS